MYFDLIFYVVYSYSLFTGDEPLYSGASISTRESWASIYQFSLSNHLTDSATQELLSLIASHCPTPNLCPQTVYKLKKLIGPLECVQSKFCSVCMKLVASTENKCSKCVGTSQTCYYTIMPFEEQIKEIFEGDTSFIHHMHSLINSSSIFRELGQSSISFHKT